MGFLQEKQGKIHIKVYKSEKDKENSISNSTNNIGSRSLVGKSIQYKLVISDNGLGFREKYSL